MTATEPPLDPESSDAPDPSPERAPDASPPQPPVETFLANGLTVNDIMKENAFHRAGVDVTSPVGQLLLTGYAGALETDPIRQAASQVGAYQAPPEPGTDELRDRQDLANGTEPLVTGPGTGPHPHEKALRAGQAVMMSGGTEEDALAASFSSMVIDAATGDKRGLVQRQAPVQY